MIRLEKHSYGLFAIVDVETGAEKTVQVDFDYPGIASSFGWSPEPVNGCRHEGTDGTVACPWCGKTATEFITEAYNFLADNDGAEVEDPGYFD